MPPSRIATLLRLFQQTPPAGVADNEEVGNALAQLAQNIRPTIARNGLEEFAQLPGHALANSIEGAGALIQPEKIAQGIKGVIQDPQPAIDGIKGFASEVAERPVALLEQLSLSDAIPGLTAGKFLGAASAVAGAVPPGGNKFLKKLGKSTEDFKAKFNVDAFHGTAGDIREFDPGLLGSTTGASSARQGFFFSADPKTAETFAKNARVEELNPKRLKDANRANEKVRAQMASEVQSLRDRGLFDEAETLNDDLIHFTENNLDEIPEGLGQNIIPAKLRMENPLVHDFEGRSYREVSYHDLLEEARSSGHDSAIFRNTRDGGPVTDIYVVFEPSQVRSKYAAFDPSRASSGDITATMPPLLFPIGIGAAAAAFSADRE